MVWLRVEVVLTGMRAAPVARIPAGVGHGKSDPRMIRLPGSNQASAARLASRSDLQAEAVDGPLIVEQTDCTLLLENGWRVSRDPNDLLVAYRETAGRRSCTNERAVTDRPDHAGGPALSAGRPRPGPRRHG